jgi:hypothetical protein
MRQTVLAFLAVVAGAFLAAPSAASPGGVAGASAPSAPARRDWSEPADFEALRAEYASRVDLPQLCDEGRPLSPAIEAMQAERWGALLALTTPWVERCPVDMEAHELRAAALRGLGRNDEAEDHEMWARGLFEAALATGDGKTPATAYRVIADWEAYALLRAFRYPPEREEQAPGGGDAFVVLANGDEQTLYFARLAPAFSEGESSERRTASN